MTHLEPDLLECKVKWALGSSSRNKASGGDEIPAESFQILKDGAVKVVHSVGQPVWKTWPWPQLRKVSFHFNHKEGQCQTVFRVPHGCTRFTC